MELVVNQDINLVIVIRIRRVSGAVPNIETEIGATYIFDVSVYYVLSM
jgi:hypothetical protein